MKKKMPNFDELIVGKTNPYYSIALRFSDFADMPLKTLYKDFADVYDELKNISQLSDDADVYSLAVKIISDYPKELYKDCHMYTEKNLRAFRMIVYLNAAMLKHMCSNNCHRLLRNIECLDDVEEILNFSNIYLEMPNNAVFQYEMKNYDINPADSEGNIATRKDNNIYNELFSQLVCLLDGGVYSEWDNFEWTLEKMPILDSCDVFYMDEVIKVVDLLNRITVILILAAKDTDFANMIKERRL